MMLAIIGIIIAVMVPGALNRIRGNQLTSLKSTLENIQAAIVNFHTDVTKYPLNLEYLSDNPTGGKDICGVGIATANANKWRGPYISLKHPYSGAGADTMGIVSTDWVIRNTMTRNPTTAATASATGRVFIEISPMRSADATELNQLVDGTTVPPLNGTADTSGVVEWTGVTNGLTVSTTWSFLVGGC
jgi:type II secretory pathway pseudopilin PulG